ncbi:hypothetical protein SLEP1_g21539 [Rubroshorea leprosula]|uniref:Uncharacterized protein n=1 Tax=Rubroshorea leprosula TaxID=152421 RepID=A0AAV5JDP7_9ROSI|nr:hypothetical protein SLEP1_g21539 [Rubroshorea leprosula]
MDKHLRRPLQLNVSGTIHPEMLLLSIATGTQPKSKRSSLSLAPSTSFLLFAFALPSK